MAPQEKSSRLILVVDDEPAIAGLLRIVLESEGHRIVVAHHGQEALDLVAQKLPDLIILDIDMPQMAGFEVCRRFKSSPVTRLIPILVLTGVAVKDRITAWDVGADEFLTKPFLPLEVVARCRSLLRQKDLVDALDSAESVVFTLARAIEAKSPFTHGHSGRVALHAQELGKRMGLEENAIDILRRGAVLHDIGKISIPDAILNKPAKLSPEEFAMIQQHPAEGARIVESLRSARDVIPLIRWHHERMDGKGYPDGLIGAKIPLLVRVLAVADRFDALTSDRPYRAAITKEQCRELMMAPNEVGLDLDLVQVFLKS